MPRLPGVPYWRLSGFYFAYFATVGALVPYLGLYYRHLGFTATQIGELNGMLVLGRVVAPTLWGWIADHRGQRMFIIRLTVILAAASFAPFLWLQGYWALLAVMLAFGFFWSASLPQFEATTLNHLGDSVEAYTHIRVWGSVGFILTVMAMGRGLERFGVTLLPPVLMMLTVSVALISLTTPESAAGHLPLSRDSLRRVLLRPEVLALFAACFLVQLAYGPYYNFYSIYLEDYGYSRTLIGQLWALGVIAEVALFVVMHGVLRVATLRALMLVSIAAAVTRWLIIAWCVGSVAMLVIAQLLHAVAFGMHHVAALQLIHRHFVGRHQGRGQALYSSVAYGAGGAVGAVLSGYTWEVIGPVWTYVAASLASAAALAVAWRWLDRGPAMPLPVQ